MTALAKAYPAPLLAVLSIIVLCGAIPLLLWSFSAPARLPDAQLVLTAVIFVSGLKFSLVLGYRDRRLHEMVLWLFVYLFLAVAPFVQIQTAFPGTTPGMDSSFALEAALIVLVGCLSLMVGIAMGNRSAAGHAPDARPVYGRNVFLLAAIALGLAAYYVSQVGFATLFAARSELSSARSDSLGGPFGTIIVAGAKMGLLVAFVALVSLWRQRKAAGQPRPVVMTGLVLVTLLVLVNPVGNARYIFGTVALAVLGAIGIYSTSRRFRLTAIGAMVGMVVVFPVLDTFRRTLDATVQLQSPVESLTTADFDSFAQIMNTAQYVQAQGITWGSQFLGVVFFWVPRDVWASKPIDTGTLLANFRGYRFTNLSAPLWTELFINLGWVGLVVGMIGFGVLIRHLDQRSEIMLRLYGAPGVAATIIPFYLLIVLRGSLLQAMANLLIIVLGAWFVTRLPKGASSTLSLSTDVPMVGSTAYR